MVLGALDTVENLQPSAVVSDQKRDRDVYSTKDIGRTRRNIEDLAAAAEKADSFTDLYQATVALYPNRVNRGVLWNSAKSFMS
jgi:hypothetical protein